VKFGCLRSVQISGQMYELVMLSDKGDHICSVAKAIAKTLNRSLTRSRHT